MFMAATQNRKYSVKRFLPLAIFVLLVGLLAYGLTLDPRRVPSPLIGKPVPAFELPLLNKSGTLSSDDLKGEISLVNAWASWCVACRAEHEVITQLSRSGLKIYGLNYKDETDDAKAWLTRLGNPYYVNAVDYDGRVGIEWGVYGTPESFLIDHNGIIRHKVIGPITPAIVTDELIPLIRQIQRETG